MKKFLIIALAAMLVLGLCACGGGATAEKPIKISSAMQFNSWFGEGKKLSKTNKSIAFLFNLCVVLLCIFLCILTDHIAKLLEISFFGKSNCDLPSRFFRKKLGKSN